jgi:hypothetical protein
MSRPFDVEDAVDEGDLPIVHPDRTIGDTAELVPGNARGDRGPLKEIIRTRGGDTRAQLLTVTIVGSGVYESSLRGASSAPRGPLVGVVEWGFRGAKAKMELDIPQGGVVFSLVASYVQVAARYDGLVVVNEQQLDPAATGGVNPGPRQRVGAMVGYGSYGAASRLTRTLRVDDVPPPGGGGGEIEIASIEGEGTDEGPTNVSARVRVPPFARRVLVTGLGLESSAYRLRFGTFRGAPVGDAGFRSSDAPRAIDLPGDAAFIEVENLGPDTLLNPAFVFELGV